MHKDTQIVTIKVTPTLFGMALTGMGSKSLEAFNTRPRFYINCYISWFIVGLIPMMNSSLVTAKTIQMRTTKAICSSYE